MPTGMLGSMPVGRLKRQAAAAYLGASAEFTSFRVRDRTGPRDFRRIVVVAALGKNNGITNGARLQVEFLKRSGLDAELVDATASLRNPLFRARHRRGTAYVFHSGGPQTASLIGSVLPDAAQAFRIGYWAWELPDPAPDWRGCDRLVHEIWTPSAYGAASLAKMTERPIHIVPHHVPERPARIRPTGRPFTVLAIADTRSSLTRKNPRGAYLAFKAAFGDSLDARLLLKLSGRDADIANFEQALDERPEGSNVRVVKGFLDDAELDSLYEEADVLVSLHRAEGFGLPMLEAMARGIPVVATGWSGNLEFMDDRNGLLVPYHLVPVEDEAGIYHCGVWAEPDVDAAAAFLRRLAEDPSHYARIAGASHRAAQSQTRPFPPAYEAPAKAGTSR